MLSSILLSDSEPSFPSRVRFHLEWFVSFPLILDLLSRFLSRPNPISFPTAFIFLLQFAAGVQALASLSPALKDPGASLLPDLPDVRAVSVHVAAAVVKRAVDEGRARVPELQGMNMEEIEEMIKQQVSEETRVGPEGVSGGRRKRR